MTLVLTFVANLVTLLGAAAAIWAVWIVAEASIYEGLLGPGLERDLGFRHGKAILPHSGMFGYISAVDVSCVTEDGPFAKAGVRKGDVLPDETHTNLFKKLHRHRGKTVELAIVDGGTGPPFHERPRRIVRILVPPQTTKRDR